MTVMFSDIADFQEISASSAPMQIVAFLNELYNVMDSRIEKFDVYKVSEKGLSLIHPLDLKPGGHIFPLQ